MTTARTLAKGERQDRLAVVGAGFHVADVEEAGLFSLMGPNEVAAMAVS